MKALYLDCASGISGNMFIGACLQLGVPEKYLRGELEKLNLYDEYELEISDVIKNGIGAAYFDVKLLHEHHDTPANIHHLHEHHHEHRTMADIRRIIDAADFNSTVKNYAQAIFGKISEAEGKVHNVPAEEVHFHEVGAIDSIIDIVGCAICLEYLSIEKIMTSRINTGSGFVKCAHGLMPIPAPATAELLCGFPTYHQGAEKELTTPTGAALIHTLATYKENIPEKFRVDRIAYGAGFWDLDIPNVLRVYFGEIEE